MGQDLYFRIMLRVCCFMENGGILAIFQLVINIFLTYTVGRDKLFQSPYRPPIAPISLDTLLLSLYTAANLIPALIGLTVSLAKILSNKRSTVCRIST